jgi:hypothetical protein
MEFPERERRWRGSMDDDLRSRLHAVVKAMMSWFRRWMQPAETALPMEDGSFVPWTR